MYITRNSCFWDDDAHYALYKEGEKLFDCLRFDFEHGGGYIGLFLCKFLSFKLPLKLNINPSDFISWGGGFFRGLFTVLTLLCMTNLLFVRKRLQPISVLFFIFLFLYFLYAVFSVKSYILAVNYNFYRYFFSLLFFSIFIGNIYKNITFKKKFDFFELLITSVCAWIIGTASEILFTMTISLFFLVIFYNMGISLFEKIKKEQFKELKFNLNYKFFIPFIINFTAIYMFTHSEIFLEIAGRRTDDFYQYINIENFINFIYCFFRIYILDEFLYWIIFIALTYCLIKKIKKRNLKKVIFPLLFIISSIISLMYLFLYNPDTNMHITIDYCPYYLSHRNIRFLFKMLYIIPLILIVGKLINYTKIKFLHIYIILLLSASAIFLIYDIFGNSKYIGNDFLFKTRQQMYITHKITTFYKRAFYWEDNERSFEYCNPINNGNYIIELSENAVSSYFYKKVYNIDLTTNYVEHDNDRINKYLKDGGTLTDEELKHIKFSRINDTLNNELDRK